MYIHNKIYTYTHIYLQNCRRASKTWQQNDLRERISSKTVKRTPKVLTLVYSRRLSLEKMEEERLKGGNLREKINVIDHTYISRQIHRLYILLSSVGTDKD